MEYQFRLGSELGLGFEIGLVVFTPSSPVEQSRRHPVRGLCMRASVIVNRKFVNTMSCKALVGISLNLQLRVVGHKDELMRFCCQKVKGQDRSNTTYGQIGSLGGILFLIVCFYLFLKNFFSFSILVCVCLFFFTFQLHNRDVLCAASLAK